MKHNFTCVAIISKTGFLTFTPFCANLVIVSKIKVAFSKSCPVVKINWWTAILKYKRQCLPSSNTSEIVVLQLSNEDILQINKGGWEIFWKKWWICFLLGKKRWIYYCSSVSMCSTSLFWEQESICLRVYALMRDLSEMNTKQPLE